jgi:GNAT superfamily N-acetyltransferase
MHLARHYCGVAPDLVIITATDEDLPALTRALGQEPFFRDRLLRQRESHGRLLVAWADGTPVGVVYVWLDEAEEPELRELLPGVPLLNHLEVVEERRNQGVGTRIIAAAERLLADLDFKHVALGIRLDNHDACRLYERLGYQEWEYGHLQTSYVVFLADGGEDRRPELCRILVKDLDNAT